MKIPVNRLIPILRHPVDVVIERRDAQPAINDLGEAIPATAVNTPTGMVTHPATRDQLERAGIDRGHGWQAFYSPTELRTVEGDLPADRLLHDGSLWELHDAGNYATLGGMFLALGKRIE